MTARSGPSRDGALYLLRIEIDGHFHGSGDVPKPWVAKITGACERYGLRREFVDRMNDWRDARRACSGNTYGVVATFPLRGGALYEVSRLRGTSSKRYVSREFVEIVDGKQVAVKPLAALARAEGHGDPVTVLRVQESQPYPWVAEVSGLGTPQRLGFVIDDMCRLYRLRVGRVYEVMEDERRRLALATERGAHPISEQEALALLRGAA
jgi:hypothetical protein